MLGIVAPSAMPSDSRRRSPPATLTTTTRLALKPGAPNALPTRTSGAAAAVASAAPAARRKFLRLKLIVVLRPSLALVLARSHDRAHDGPRAHRGVGPPRLLEGEELVRARLAAEVAVELLGDERGRIGDGRLVRQVGL